ncbi:MAG: ankyrin repeat domain-containing protein [Gemmatimonadota bacterium]|nr:ankyrin repeat domain-containing protein [Gemmatimonadota bacterium]
MKCRFVVRACSAVLAAFSIGVANAQSECTDWSELEAFWGSATVEDGIRCLDRGVDVNARMEEGVTMLHAAAAVSENPAVIATLIEHGADVHARFEYDATALHGAAMHNSNPAVIATLLDAGADPNARADAIEWFPSLCAEHSGWTPLHCVAFANSNAVAVIRTLIDGGADPNARNEVGYTPLHAAAGFKGNPDVFIVLLDAGADPNAQGLAGYTPLHVAAEANPSAAAIEALLDGGADIRVQTDYRRTACDVARDNDEISLHIARESGRPIEELKFESHKFLIDYCDASHDDGD